MYVKRAFFALIACVSFLGAQTAEDPAPTFRSDTRLVVLHAAVTDKEGHHISNLPRSAFQVYENGAEQHIKIFRHEDIPVSLGLVIDNSASMRDKRAKVEAASLALVRASNPEDEVFILNFNDEPSLDQEFTNNINTLQASIARVDSRGGTAMRDAIQMAIDHLYNRASKDKKILLVITDGEDNESKKATVGSILADAQDAGIMVYTIGLLNEEDPRAAKRAKRDLDAITFATGGQAFYPKDVSEVDRIAAQVAHDVRNQYTIAYSPSNPALDGTFRTIKVLVNAPNAVVRSRSGYYASPESTAQLKK